MGEIFERSIRHSHDIYKCVYKKQMRRWKRSIWSHHHTAEWKHFVHRYTRADRRLYKYINTHIHLYKPKVYGETTLRSLPRRSMQPQVGQARLFRLHVLRARQLVGLVQRLRRLLPRLHLWSRQPVSSHIYLSIVTYLLLTIHMWQPRQFIHRRRRRGRRGDPAAGDHQGAAQSGARM